MGDEQHGAVASLGEQVMRERASGFLVQMLETGPLVLISTRRSVSPRASTRPLPQEAAVAGDSVTMRLTTSQPAKITAPKGGDKVRMGARRIPQ